MCAWDRVIATVVAVIVWAFAGYAIASGPTESGVVAPTVLNATVACILPTLH